MMTSNVPVQGSVSKGFEPVGKAFAENLTRGNELGAACCIYYKGERIVDTFAPMSLLADHPNIQFNFWQGGVGTCQLQVP